MKRTLSRSIFIAIISFAFIFGLGLFTYRIFVNADMWVQQEYNGHISGSYGLAQAGKIYDRDGEILAQSIDGERIYNEDETTRKSTLHVVGDNSLNISTAIQSTYRSDLTSFNYIWGLELPDSFKQENNLTLTIDADACNAAYEALGDRRGAVVVMNYETGEVICSVSNTTYDPQNPPEITEENESEYDGAYLDRVLSSSYTPGSIFKIVTAAAAIENIPDIESKTYQCEGGTYINGQFISCLSHHGTIGFNDALAQSCNATFAQIAVEVGAEEMQKTAEEMGIMSSFDVGNISTALGNYAVLDADDAQLGWSGIGQYTDLVNPMQMAILMGAIATDGTSIEPYILANKSTNEFYPVSSSSPTYGKELLSSSTASVLNDMLRYDVTSNYGDSMFADLEVCAKTGTAEVSDGDKNDAWMVGFSRDEDAPLAFAVVVEDGEFGYSTAGPVAVAAMEASAKAIRES